MSGAGTRVSGTAVDAATDGAVYTVTFATGAITENCVPVASVDFDAATAVGARAKRVDAQTVQVKVTDANGAPVQEAFNLVIGC